MTRHTKEEAGAWRFGDLPACRGQQVCLCPGIQHSLIAIGGNVASWEGLARGDQGDQNASDSWSLSGCRDNWIMEELQGVGESSCLTANQINQAVIWQIRD